MIVVQRMLSELASIRDAKAYERSVELGRWVRFALLWIVTLLLALKLCLREVVCHLNAR
jgi:hypothetical protein